MTLVSDLGEKVGTAWNVPSPIIGHDFVGIKMSYELVRYTSLTHPTINPIKHIQN